MIYTRIVSIVSWLTMITSFVCYLAYNAFEKQSASVFTQFAALPFWYLCEVCLDVENIPLMLLCMTLCSAAVWMLFSLAACCIKHMHRYERS